MGKMISSGPYDLSVEQREGSFVLCFQEAPVKTRKGNLVAHASAGLLQHMIHEFDARGEIGVENGVIEEPKILSSYSLFCIQKDFVESHEDELFLNFGECLRQDSMLYRCAGPEVTEQWYRWGPVINYLKELGLKLPNLISSPLEDRSAFSSDEEYEAGKSRPHRRTSLRSSPRNRLQVFSPCSAGSCNVPLRHSPKCYPLSSCSCTVQVQFKRVCKRRASEPPQEWWTPR